MERLRKMKILKPFLKYHMRRPVVKNKYKLLPSDIEKLKIADMSKTKDWPFIRSSIVKGTVLTDTACEGYCRYRLVFFDDDSPFNEGKNELILATKHDRKALHLDRFYNRKKTTCTAELQIQEKLIRRLNALLDAGTITKE